jgi:hypothetical protein
MRPEYFAEYVCAVGRWFNGAKIAFEGSGVGVGFSARLRELSYPNLFYMTNTKGIKLDKPGWFAGTGDMDQALFREYQRALTAREFTNPDEVALNECQMYEWGENQTIRHVGSVSQPDPSGAKKNHGDRVRADVFNWMLMRNVRVPDSPEIVSHNTLAYMQREIERQEALRDSWSPRDVPEPWCRVR